MAKSTAGSDYDFLFKLVLIGDSSVGKSNLLLRFTRNEFRLNTQTTIGVEFASRELIIDKKRIETQVWDTAGQERFKTVIPQLYRGSNGILVVFDLGNSATFDHITSWIEEVRQHTPPDLPIILIGNKSDLVNRRQVSREQATDLAKRFNISYMETSALNSSNVEEAFTTLVTNIYHKKKLKSVNHSSAMGSVEHGPTSTIPVSFEPRVEISSTPKSFYLKNNDESTTPKKGGGCC